MTDTLLWFGDTVKATADGKFTGYLVRFSSADDPDLSGQFFTKETDFGFTDTIKSPVYFNHRLPLKTKDGQSVIVKSQIGEATLSLDDTGVLIDAIVWNRKKYEKNIVAAGKAGHLGWSSGTAKHLVDIEPDGHIKKWPLGLDASQTPIPCEPRNDAIEAKSIGALKFQPIEEIEMIEDVLDVKGLFAEALAERSPSSWEMESAFRDVLREIAQAAEASNVTGVAVDIPNKVREAATEYTNALVPLAVGQINDWLESENRSEPFYLRSLYDELKDAPAASRFIDDLALALAAAQEVQTRAKSLNEIRVKAGRQLSEANRTRLTKLLQGLQSCAGDIDTLLKDTEPQPKSVDPALVNGLVATFELFKMRQTRAGEELC